MMVLNEEDTNEFQTGYKRGSTEMLDRVRASLADYPNIGGDAIVMQHVDRIVKAALEPYFKRAREIAAEFIGYPTDEHDEQLIASADPIQVINALDKLLRERTDELNKLSLDIPQKGS